MVKQALCFYQSFCLVDIEVLRNPHLRVAAKRQHIEQPNLKNNTMKNLTVVISIVMLLMLVSCKNNSRTTNDSALKLESNQFVGSWVQPNPINDQEVQGFILNVDGTAQSINMATLLYKKWWLDSGKLVLVLESIGNKVSSVDTIKYDVIVVNAKELKLKDGEFIDEYRKK